MRKKPTTLEEAIAQATITRKDVYFGGLVVMVVGPSSGDWMVGPSVRSFDIDQALGLFKRLTDTYKRQRIFLYLLGPAHATFQSPADVEAWLAYPGPRGISNRNQYKLTPSPWTITAARRR